MNKISFLLLLLGLSLTLNAQEKSATNRGVTSNFTQIEIIRMDPGTDLLEGLDMAIKDKKIVNAVILAGIGSITDYHYHVVSDKPGNLFTKASASMDLVNLQGYILNGLVHAHMGLSDENSMVGGHVEPGTIAKTFFIITIGVLPDSLDVSNIANYRK